ncbi:MAG: Asp-tRNA(Asn)/Glu-tRNA(Gln) amidotransferase subunit GatB [Candidatus Saccharimonadales bacterium]
MDKIFAKYQADIGIETHVQLKTQTKLFAAVSNDSRSAEPNMNISPLCYGLPGTLPVLNKEAINLAIRAGIALNGRIAKNTKFDRKNYFYPDLPKGYQITQFDKPIVGEGSVRVPTQAGEFIVGIERAHLEEDAGKSTHPEGADYTLVDFNRAGTPLLEVVSKPDIHTPEQAKLYAQELYNLMRYADVSDADLYHGNMRFDVNISVRPKGTSKLGTRAEIKNLNSFRSVERSAEYEIKRQVELLEKGKTVTQETRGWDEAKAKTVAQRSKEEAHDYRYFPEPDIPPLVIKPELIEEIKKAMPLVPNEIREKLKKAGLDFAQRETLLSEPAFIDLILDVKTKEHIKRIANWLVVDVQGMLVEKNMKANEAKLNVQSLEELAEMVNDSKLSSTGAKSVLEDILESGDKPETIAARLQVTQLSKESELEEWVDRVIAENPQAAKDFKSGEAKAIGFLVGQAMKLSRGQANPQKVQKILKKKLKN